jgi:hypothetical protein
MFSFKVMIIIHCLNEIICFINLDDPVALFKFRQSSLLRFQILKGMKYFSFSFKTKSRETKKSEEIYLTSDTELRLERIQWS